MRRPLRVAAALLTLSVAGCQSSGPTTTTQESSAVHASAAESRGAVEYTISYDGVDCTSTLPEQISSTTFTLEVLNADEASMELIIGYYDEGFDRDDTVAHLEERVAPPAFANDVFTRSVTSENPFSGDVELEPNRYYVICLVQSLTEAIVLPDLVVEG